MSFFEKLNDTNQNPGFRQRDHEGNRRSPSERRTLRSIGPGNVPSKYSGRRAESAPFWRSHLPISPQKDGSGPLWTGSTNVLAPSPPRKGSPDASLMVDNLSDSRLSAVSHKRRAENVSLSPKRTRHSRPDDKAADLDKPAVEPLAPDPGPEPGPNPDSRARAAVTDTVTTWQRNDFGQPGGAMPVDGDAPEGDTNLVLEPQTRPITQEQLINEVKGIYAGLVMVEKKCVEITQQRTKSASKLSNDQWQALIALHRTLLHEHHDFFLASQHPTASPALKRLANKYAMPARMWRHGIHSFLELLRQQLPDSLDHMLAFVYIAYSMMALLKESVPSFVETWIECLGDLARYRMAIEDNDMHDREIWSKVARTWYNQAADRSPNVGRIQHHLAVLARPNIVQQLFLYSKALVSVVPFVNARDSIMLLFSPLLEKPDKASDRYSATEASLVTAYAYLFTRKSLSLYQRHAKYFVNSLDGHIGRSSNKWKIQGPEVASSLIAGVMDFGKDDNPVWMMYQECTTTLKVRRTLPENADLAAQEAEDVQLQEIYRDEFWTKEDLSALPRAPAIIEESAEPLSSISVTILSMELFASAIRINANKIGDKNIVPFMSFVLSFLLSLSYVGTPLIYLESHIPWHSIVTFLNTLGRSGVSDYRTEAESFPIATSGTGRQLPEDYLARGAIWAPHLFPPDFFTQHPTDEDERHLELSSHTTPRSERCLWLGIRLAMLGRYIHYDTLTKQFAVTEFASRLQKAGSIDNALPQYMHHLVHHTLHASQSESASIPSVRTEAGTMGTQTLGARTAETDPDYVVVDNVRAVQSLNDETTDRI